MNAAQQAERIKELEKELRESKELIVAMITSNGKSHIDKTTRCQVWELYVDDHDIMHVDSESDVLSNRYDNKRGGNVYEVRR